MLPLADAYNYVCLMRGSTTRLNRGLLLYLSLLEVGVGCPPIVTVEPGQPASQFVSPSFLSLGNAHSSFAPSFHTHTHHSNHPPPLPPSPSNR